MSKVPVTNRGRLLQAFLGPRWVGLAYRSSEKTTRKASDQGKQTTTQQHCQTRLPELNTTLKQGVGGMGEATKSAASRQGRNGRVF